MYAVLRDYWVTVLVDRCRTRDYLIRARSEYSASWVYEFCNPGVEIIHVRPVSKDAVKIDDLS